MNIMNGVAVAIGAGVMAFKGAEKALESGHYVAKGLRVAANGVDFVTDVAQEKCRLSADFCTAYKASIINRNKEESKDEAVKVTEVNVNEDVALAEELVY